MKRSEMIDKLYEYFCDTEEEGSPIGWAEGILYLVEKEGMLPPPKNRELDKITDEYISWELRYPRVILENGDCPLWEPEDENSSKS